MTYHSLYIIKFLISGSNNFYFRIGYVVSCNPWKVIVACLLISAACLAGIVEFKEENRGEKNWVAQDSDPVKHNDWISKVFPLNNRPVGLMLERTDHGNMLTKESLLQVTICHYCNAKNVKNTRDLLQLAGFILFQRTFSFLYFHHSCTILISWCVVFTTERQSTNGTTFASSKIFFFYELGTVPKYINLKEHLLSIRHHLF